MDYKNGKIYKIQFSSGYFYIGSTAGDLRRRLWQHRHSKKTGCAKHIQKNTSDECRIILVEEYPCEDKNQLRRKEDEHIQIHMANEFCLNVVRAFTTPEEKADYYRQWRKDNIETINQKDKEYAKLNETRLKEYRRQYYENNKDRIKAYKEENRERIATYQKAYDTKRRNIKADEIKTNL